MSKPARSARLLQLAAALCLVVSPLPASATSALFDFDDFRYEGPYSGPEFEEAPYTFDYGCDGKPYCTGAEIVGTNLDADHSASRVSTVRNGIGMEIGRYGYSMSINYSNLGLVDVGNDPIDEYTLFLLDFDTPLSSFAADIRPPRLIDDDFCFEQECPPNPTTDVFTLIQVYLWSDPGGQGDLVGSLTISFFDEFEVVDSMVHVALTSAQPFRSVNFGQAVSYDASCIRGQVLSCGELDGRPNISVNYTALDNVLVSTVPEPSTALLVVAGLIGARFRRGRT